MVRRLARLVPLALLPLAVLPVALSPLAGATTPTITLSLHSETPTGQVPNVGSGYVLKPNGNTAAQFFWDNDGDAQVTVPAGRYFFRAGMGITPGGGASEGWSTETDLMDLTSNQAVDLSPPGHLVTFDLTDGLRTARGSTPRA